MKTAVANIRNFALVGHAGAGKTTLAELMLFKSGVVPRPGSVDQKTSVSDFRPEEQERKCSLYSAALNCPWKNHHFYFMDTPGSADFCGEALAAQSVADAIIIVVDAVSGIGPGTMRALKQAKANNQPRAIFINGLDRDQADFHKILSRLQEAFGGPHVCVPFVLPVGTNSALKGVVPVLKKDAPFPPELVEEATHDRQEILDDVAEEDETLMEHYLTDGDLTPEELDQGLHLATLHNHIVPVFCGSAAKDIGITELMDGIIGVFPNPVMEPPLTLSDGSTLERRENAECGMAQVFKSVADPFIGQLSYVRIFSGTFKADTDLHNISNNDSKERAAAFLRVNGKEQAPEAEAVPGMIVAIAKLKATHINQTLATKATKAKFALIDFPKPTLSYAISAKVKADEEKLGNAIHRMTEEDPTIRLEHNAETKESLLHGMGDQHLNNVVTRLRNTFKVEVDLRTPRVPYRETITGNGSHAYRHKKQTGGHGQFAEVHLRVEHLTDKEYEFASEVVGGNIPRNFIPAIEKGVLDAKVNGPLAGCHVINFKAVVYDGKYHDVDSSEMAFKIAARAAFREAMKAAKPMLLEPIMKLKIIFPDQYMGDITGDLNSRRGRVLGMDTEDGQQVVLAEVPMAETFTYSSTLRSLTQGRGGFEMAFDRYEAVPGNISKKVQEEAAKHRVAEADE